MTLPAGIDISRPGQILWTVTAKGTPIAWRVNRWGVPTRLPQEDRDEILGVVK